VLHSDDFVEAIRAAIADEAVRRLPPYIGSIDQFVDSTDVLSEVPVFRGAAAIYDRISGSQPSR
jgi:hypothetical protein